MPPDLALSPTLIGSNYPCLQLIFLVPKVFEPLKFDCISTGTMLKLDIQIFSKRYPITCKVYTRYRDTSEIEHGVSTCPIDNPLAKAC